MQWKDSMHDFMEPSKSIQLYFCSISLVINIINDANFIKYEARSGSGVNLEIPSWTKRLRVLQLRWNQRRSCCRILAWRFRLSLIDEDARDSLMSLDTSLTVKEHLFGGQRSLSGHIIGLMMREGFVKPSVKNTSLIEWHSVFKIHTHTVSLSLCVFLM